MRGMPAMSDQERISELRQAGVSRPAIAALVGASVEQVHAAARGEGSLPVAGGGGGVVVGPVNYLDVVMNDPTVLDPVVVARATPDAPSLVSVRVAAFLNPGEF